MKPPPIIELSRKTIGPDGRLGRRTDGFDEAEANYHGHGAHAPSDYRYNAFYAYLLESPSFLAVRAKLRGEPCGFPLPKDWKAVEAVAQDFIDVSDELPFGDWWRGGGFRLFATQSPVVNNTSTVELLTEKNQKLCFEWSGTDAVVIRIGLNSPRGTVFQQISDLMDRLTYDPQTPSLTPPKYKFMSAGVRRTTLEAGRTALQQLRLCGPDLPLWWVGNALNLIPSQCFTQDQYDRFTPDELTKRKQLLAVAASRLTRTAVYFAENATRGRFPSAKPFPEANRGFFKRTFGRPRSD